MRESLKALLNVNTDLIDGLFLKLPYCATGIPDRVKTYFYYVRIRDGRVRDDDLLEALCSSIVTYCLNRAEYCNIQPKDIRGLWLRAKSKFQTKNTISGEPGELLAYLLTEGCLEAPKILSKMALKTNPEMPVHGSDGVHLGIEHPGSFDLHFIEAKTYASCTQGITAALQSVRGALDQKNSPLATGINYEISLVSSHLDVPEGPLRDALLDILDPYSAAKDTLRYRHTCLIAFNCNMLDPLVNQDEFVRFYCHLAEGFERYLAEKVAGDNMLLLERWDVFFVPFASVDSFREQFMRRLQA
jgi:hypothetical protein